MTSQANSPRHHRIVVGVVAGLLLLSGCAGGAQPGPARPTATAATETTPTQTPTPTAAPVVDVDPEAYQVKDLGHYFTALGGDLSCGFVTGGEAGLAVGCQAWVKVANLPKCDDPTGLRSPAIYFDQGKPAQAECFSEGAFASGTRELQPGQRLTVDAVACTARAEGVTCTEQASGRGFTASLKEFVPVG